MTLTKHAPAERAAVDEIGRQHQSVASDPLFVQLLDGIPSHVAVLNGQRQAVFVNRSMANLAVNLCKDIVGVRPGELLGCIHSADEPGGCGTSAACRNCGTVSAILARQITGSSHTVETRMTVGGSDGDTSLDLEVTAAPLLHGQGDFTLLSLRDISAEKRRTVLERMFFHDLLNLAGGLQGLLEILPGLPAEEAAEVQRLAAEVSVELRDEILAGRALSDAEKGELQVSLSPIDIPAFLESVAGSYRKNPCAQNRFIFIVPVAGSPVLQSDSLLLRRILGNLVQNALEAISKGQTVTISYQALPQPVFRVHNPGAIPSQVALQIFQRSFSTKGSSGRGIGTYSVKMLIERYLKGSVRFESNINEGTTFEVRLPSE